jgi:hypothetical protein
MIRVDSDGYLGVRMGGAGMTFQGIILPGDSNLFAVFTNSIGAAPYFLIAKGIQLPRADLLEGLLLLSALDAAHTPAAVPIVLERIGELSGDRDSDDLRCAELINSAPIAKDGEVPDEILSRLVRDVGPAASTVGGERFLMTAAGALSRGSTVEIARGNRGECQIVAEINGARISTVYDTGASAVVLTQEAAKAAGLPLDFLNYSVQVETANGRTRAAPVTLVFEFEFPTISGIIPGIAARFCSSAPVAGFNG